MANVIYNEGLDYWNDWDEYATPVDYVYAMLVGSGYTPDKDDELSDVTPYEAEDTINGATPTYSRIIVTNRTQTLDYSLDRMKYDADDLVWPSLITDDPIVGVVLYLYEPAATPSTKLLGYWSFSSTQPNGTPFSIIWGSAGVVYLKQGS